MDKDVIRKELGVPDGVTFDLNKDPAVMSREELVTELRFRRGLEQVHPNSYASLFLMDGRQTHKHMYNVMNPIQKGALFVTVTIFAFIGIILLSLVVG